MLRGSSRTLYISVQAVMRVVNCAGARMHKGIHGDSSTAAIVISSNATVAGALGKRRGFGPEEPPRATRSQPESIRTCISPNSHFFPGKTGFSLEWSYIEVRRIEVTRDLLRSAVRCSGLGGLR